TPGQVVQGGHSTIIASGAEIIPGCAIDHIHWSACARRRTGDPGAGCGAPVDLASNDYLGLCGDKRLTSAAVEAAWEWGTGSTGSRLVTGTTALHARLEARLAGFAGAAGALVFSSGYL